MRLLDFDAEMVTVELADGPARFHALWLRDNAQDDASRHGNDVLAMARAFAPRVHFVHLRNVKKGSDVRGAADERISSFVESDHLDGDVPVCDVVRTMLDERKRRVVEAGAHQDLNYGRLPFRPDHGHQMCDDLSKTESNPGYTAIGRLRGLAELRGLQLAILSSA